MFIYFLVIFMSTVMFTFIQRSSSFLFHFDSDVYVYFMLFALLCFLSLHAF